MNYLPDDSNHNSVELNDSVVVGDINIVSNSNGDVLSCPQCGAKGNISLIPCSGSSPYEKDPRCFLYICNYCNEKIHSRFSGGNIVRCNICQSVYDEGEKAHQRLADEKQRLADEKQRLVEEEQRIARELRDSQRAIEQRRTLDIRNKELAKEVRMAKEKRRQYLLNKRFWTRVAYLSMVVGILIINVRAFAPLFAGEGMLIGSKWSEDDSVGWYEWMVLSFCLFIPLTINFLLGSFFAGDSWTGTFDKTELEGLNKDLDEI